MKAENHIFHRMLHHPLILNQYRLREDFVFDSEKLRVLYEDLLANGEVTPRICPSCQIMSSRLGTAF